MPLKILFFIPSPREIPEVRKPIKEILYNRFDVIWFKYYDEVEAYRLARSYFLNDSKQYDYLCIIPDDLVINRKGIDLLLNELENPSIDLFDYGERYPVLSGICNQGFVNINEYNRMLVSGLVISPTGDPKDKTILYPNFTPRKELMKYPNDIMQFLYVGFSCEFIHRNVIKGVPFREKDEEGGRRATGIDVYFSRDLEDLGIPQYIHRQAQFIHLRGLSVQFARSISVNPDIIFTNKYKKFIKFVPSK